MASPQLRNRGDFRLGGRGNGAYNAGAMTRPQIEACAKLFIVLLIIAFFYAGYRVIALMGLV